MQFEAKGTQKKLNALRKRAAAAAEDEARCLDAELVIARRQKLKDICTRRTTTGTRSSSRPWGCR